MGTHMKTTIEIADSLLREAKGVATREHTTLRRLVEDGLRIVLQQRRGRRATPRIEPVVFGGEGLSPEYAEAGWDEIRDAIYRGRGA